MTDQLFRDFEARLDEGYFPTIMTAGRALAKKPDTSDAVLDQLLKNFEARVDEGFFPAVMVTGRAVMARYNRLQAYLRSEDATTG